MSESKNKEKSLQFLKKSKMASLANLAPRTIAAAPAPVAVAAAPDVPSSAVPVMVVSAQTYNLSNQFGNALLIFVILICLFWIILYTFNPKMVQSTDNNGSGKPSPDAARCFVGGLVSSFVIVVIWWLFRTCG